MTSRFSASLTVFTAMGPACAWTLETHKLQLCKVTKRRPQDHLISSTYQTLDHHYREAMKSRQKPVIFMCFIHFKKGHLLLLITKFFTLQTQMRHQSQEWESLSHLLVAAHKGHWDATRPNQGQCQLQAVPLLPRILGTWASWSSTDSRTSFIIVHPLWFLSLMSVLRDTATFVLAAPPTIWSNEFPQISD